MEDLRGSIEAHEFIFLKRKGVQEPIQALQARRFKKNANFERDKGKSNQEKFKKYVISNSQKIKFDGKSKYFKKGGGI